MTTVATGAAAAYEKLISLVREANLLESTLSLLSWDQETMMPPGGLEFRSRQMALMASLHHRMATDARIADLLAACEEDSDLVGEPESVTAVNLREIRRQYERKRKLPESLVEELAQVTSIAQHEWAEARKASDFARFRPWLERVIALTRRKAECFGWPRGGEPWDALAEDFEPGCTAADVQKVFVPLRTRLQALITRLQSARRTPRDDFNHVQVPIEAQSRFVRYVSEQIGFDYARGRLDRSAHPFCGGTHCNDVRLTTRFRDTNVNDALGSTMHESGHGMYEQGLPAEHIGTPMGNAVSLSIHESQSRLWENQVGRSRAFWIWCAPKLQEFFGDAVTRFSVDDLYGAANIVTPSLIRVEADEATYNMHIMVRFELERALVRGDLAPADIPGTWNVKYKEYLGLDVPDDRRGCLQDIHWSSGNLGYFPTYTLGTLYAAQFFEKALQEIPGLYKQVERGEFSALRHWLNENIHAQGMRYRSAELCRHVTGKPLGAEPLMRHLEGKLLPLYG